MLEKDGERMALNEKQERFCEEYLIDLNATQAAVRAGYKARSARQQGSDLLSKAAVRARIDELKAERSRRTEISADRVLTELARVAFYNPRDVLDFRTAQVLEKATEDDLRVIAGVKVKYVPHKTEDGDFEEAIEREVRLCDKLKALDMLAKHLGVYDKTAAASDGSETGVIEMPPVMEAPAHE